MPGWVWALIIVAAVAVVAIVIWRAMRERRSRTLRGRFGPEYDRAARRLGEQAQRGERACRTGGPPRQARDHAVVAGARERYVAEWQRVQARFVDDPEGAVREADVLIQSVMSERGYPMDDFDQRAADISVDHPRVVENYREGNRLARANALGDGTTEDLRQAMQHYRALFDELLEEASDEPVSRDSAAAGEPQPAPRS